MNRTDLQHLSKDALIDLVLWLQRPEPTSRTSSKPPSTDRKERRERAKPGGAKPGHEHHNRKLEANPDAIFDHKPTSCPACGGDFAGDETHELISEYDAIELPPVKPHVERHRRFACKCRHCGLEVKAKAPPASKGTPFGPRIHGLAIYLKTFQALSYQRLQRLFSDLFGLGISQGGLMNLFSRSDRRFAGKAEKAKAILRQARVVASDETGVRIEGTNAFHWVFRCKDAVVHQPDFTRAAQVVRTMMAGHKPEVWLSDRYAGQQKHGAQHQTCLAHLARKVAFAHEHGGDDLPLRFKLWLGRTFGLADGITKIAATTLALKRRKLEKQLDSILASPTACDLASELQGQIARARHQLLVFCAFPGEVEPTNNACERDLRPAVIQRKITNGYRAMWAAQAEANVRTTIATAKLRSADTFSTILGTLA